MTTPPSFELPSEQLAKAMVHMRALRRQVLSYWYATIEDAEASAIEAGLASMTVNILDEAIFEFAHGDRYKKFRLNDRLGQVITGLELVRNCETHSPVHYEELLVERTCFSVPLYSGGAVMRTIYAWAEFGSLPKVYVDLNSSATANQKRARGEAQHGYRQAIGGRVVTETLLDAISFFERLDPRLALNDGPELRCAYGEISERHSASEASRVVIARPMGLDATALLLPDIVTRRTERRSASWPAADSFFKDKVRRAKQHPPAVEAREVLHTVLDENGSLIGYSGLSTAASGVREAWVERKNQVGKDVRAGFKYYVETRNGPVDVALGDHSGGLRAVNSEDVDQLALLTAATDPVFDMQRLMMVEAFPDLYLQMRNNGS
ncbi:hypothetical protein ACFTZB_01025 [Rhodococcus sp. NPDC057014]|uniref:hypothetical protein n=1 Tax=Rhodococcus sp. NPDC057014 TaxID=3346000 RepID=UPI00363FBF20